MPRNNPGHADLRPPGTDGTVRHGKPATYSSLVFQTLAAMPRSSPQPATTLR